MKVAIIGATGRVGSQLVKELLSRGHEVRAIARSIEKVEQQSGVERVQGDVTDSVFAETLKGVDAVISTYGVKLTSPTAVEDYIKGADNILESARRADVPYLLFMGGAGSLYLPDGTQYADAPFIPKEMFPAVDAARRYYAQLKERRDVNWAYFSPAGMFGMNVSYERTGKYRLSGDAMIFNADGKPANISVPDLACALVDDVEKKAHLFSRFTAAEVE